MALRGLGIGARIRGLGFRDLGFRVQGLGLKFRVCGSMLKA